MQLTKQKRGDCEILLVSGRLDGTTSPQFESEFSAWLRQGGKNFVLDLGGVSFLSSAALRVLLSGAKRLTRVGGRIVLSSPGSVVREVFEISNFTALFTIFDSLDEAVLAMEQESGNKTASVLPATAVQTAPGGVRRPEAPAVVSAPQPLPPPKIATLPPELRSGETAPAPAITNASHMSPGALAGPQAVPTNPVLPLEKRPVPSARAFDLQIVVGGKAVRCRDGDILGREGTMAKHLFGELQPRHAMIGKDEDAWFLLVPKDVQTPTLLDGVAIPAGVRQHLTGEHRLSVGNFSASLRLVERTTDQAKSSLLGRLLRLVGLAR